MDRATVFGDDPAAQARAFEAAGCQWLHLVDLDGAFAARPVNAAAVEFRPPSPWRSAAPGCAARVKA